MNKKVVFPLVISALLLAGCNNQGESTPNLVLKEVPMHMVNIGAADKDGQIDLTKEEKTNFRLYFDENEPLTPYVNVAEAFRYYIDDVENLISSEAADNRSYQITLANKNKDEFEFVIDTQIKAIQVSGNLAKVSKNDYYFDASSNAIDGKTEDKTIAGEETTPYVVSYKHTGLKAFGKDNNIYAPLSLISSFFKHNDYPVAFYDYSDVFVFADPLTIDKYKFKVSGDDGFYTLSQRMKRSIEEYSFKAMPEYVKKHNRDMLTFVFENYYGLKYSKNIPSMTSYLSAFAYYDALLSEVPTDRADALKLFFSELQDGHTALLGDATAWEEKSTASLPQSLGDTRLTIEEALKNKRMEIYDKLGLGARDVRYSADGKTAVIRLQKFGAYDDAFDEKTKKLIVTMEEILKQDTYFQTKKALEAVKAKGGVERVIIDMSTNDGGDSATMGKLLALISPANQSVMYFHNTLTNSVYTTTTRLDMNMDGKVDEDDETYGDDFRFYMLTSPAAFSCGTAFPFYAQHSGFAKIIGVKPAGGECVLATDRLPNGQSYAHSGTLRVCYPSGNDYVYDEAGVKMDTDISYEDFYNLEAIVKELKEAEQEAAENPGDEE